MPLRTHPREVMAKPVGARPRHEAHKFFDKNAAVWVAETNFAASHEAHKVCDKHLQYDYVKTAQAASGAPRFLKPVCLEERGAPSST